MTVTENILNNNALASLTKQAAPKVLSAIKSASAKTGVDFAYLMEKAAAESSFKPDIKSKTSSATGLFQFIESTWLGMVKRHGDKYGLGDLAAKIDDNNKVSDPAVKKQILELRKDPEKASMLAAEFALENKNHMERYLGHDIGKTELYLAHFMGAGGATAFMQAMEENPLTPAADIFPKAARANRNVFYDSKTGQPRSLAGVYDYFDKKFGGDDLEMVEPQTVRKPKAPSTNVYSYNSRGNAALMAMLSGQNDTPMPFGTQRTAGVPNPAAALSKPVELMMLAQLDMPDALSDRQQDNDYGWRSKARYND